MVPYLNKAGQIKPMHMKNKILLVDDNDDLLQITGLILKSQGYQTISASNVHLAESLIEREHPHLILLDVCICEESGLLFCNRLKQSAATKGIRIILMSGNDYNQSDWNGADDFLLKPFDFNLLTQKVEQQMQWIERRLTA